MWEVSPPSAECLMCTVTPTVTQCGPVTALEVRIGIGTYWYWYVMVSTLLFCWQSDKV